MMLDTLRNMCTYIHHSRHGTKRLPTFLMLPPYYTHHVPLGKELCARMDSNTGVHVLVAPDGVGKTSATLWYANLLNINKFYVNDYTSLRQNPKLNPDKWLQRVCQQERTGAKNLCESLLQQVKSVDEIVRSHRRCTHKNVLILDNFYPEVRNVATNKMLRRLAEQTHYYRNLSVIVNTTTPIVGKELHEIPRDILPWNKEQMMKLAVKLDWETKWGIPVDTDRGSKLSDIVSICTLSGQPSFLFSVFSSPSVYRKLSLLRQQALQLGEAWNKQA